MRSLLNLDDRQALLTRFRSLRPETPARWGRMDAPRMLVHLTDQMHHTLGDVTARPRPGPLRWPIIRQLVMYWLPWPKGRVKGPSEAFVELIRRFVDREERMAWPDHALFGRMTKQIWGYFCHRHFGHHLRQFGA